MGEIDRKQSVAEALRQQSLTPDQGQQSYISPLVKIAQAMIAKGGRREADRMQQDVNTKIKTARAEELARYQGMTQPGSSGKPDLAAIAQAVMTTSDPAIQAAMKPYLDAYGEMLKGGVQAKGTIDLRDPNDPTKVTSYQTFADGSRQELPGQIAEALTFQGQVGLDPRTGKPVQQAPADPEGIAIRADPKPGEVVGEIVPNNAALQPKLALANAGAARTTNQTFVNTGEKSYATQFGGKLAEMDAGYLDAAMGAPARYRRAGEVLEILKKVPTTGTFANQRLFLEKALSTAGIIDGTNVANTEALATNLAGQTLDAIKSSGLGTGNGFTDKDRLFLQDASAGTIAMSAANLRRIAELNQRAASEAQKKGKIVVQRLRGNPSTAAFADQIEADLGEPLEGPPMTAAEFLAAQRAQRGQR